MPYYLLSKCPLYPFLSPHVLRLFLSSVKYVWCYIEIFISIMNSINLTFPRNIRKCGISYNNHFFMTNNGNQTHTQSDMSGNGCAFKLLP